jgi:hypothetical protein
MAAFSNQQRIQLDRLASEFRLIATKECQRRPTAANCRTGARDIGKYGRMVVPGAGGRENKSVRSVVDGFGNAPVDRSLYHFY